jgi:hypothetical protein
MPLLEVLHAAQEPASREQKRAFARSAVEIFRDVLGTPDGRLRVVFYPLSWDDTIEGLLDSSGDDEHEQNQ